MDNTHPINGDYLEPGETVNDLTQPLNRMAGRQCRKCRWRFSFMSGCDDHCVQCKGHLEQEVDIEGVPFTQWEGRQICLPYKRLGDQIVYVGYPDEEAQDAEPLDIIKRLLNP